MKLVVLSWVRNEQYGQNDLNAVQYLYIVWYKNVIVQRLSQTKWSKLNTNQSTFHFENYIKIMYCHESLLVMIYNNALNGLIHTRGIELELQKVVSS